MRKKKVAIIGTVGIPANYGGFETLAEHFVEELGDIMDISVYCTTENHKKEDRKADHKGARLIYIPFKAHGIQSIIYDCLSILHSLLYANVLLILGAPCGFIIPFVRLFTNKTIITSIDGTERERNQWSKVSRWYLRVSEWLAVRFSHVSIADNESIQNYTAVRYSKLRKIIEHGTDHVVAGEPTYTEKIKYPFLSFPYAINECSIEPENNIHVVMDAFRTLQTHNLVIVGNWNSSEYGKTLKEKYSACTNIYMVDAGYDPNEINMIRCNATVYIHAHSSECTSLSLVEAMHLQLPVIAFNANYNRATTENNALYFRNAEELMSVLRHKTVRELKQMGQRMGAIAIRRYKWSIIANKYLFPGNITINTSLS